MSDCTFLPKSMFSDVMTIVKLLHHRNEPTLHTRAFLPGEPMKQLPAHPCDKSCRALEILGMRDAGYF